MPPKEFYVPYVGYPNNNKVWVPKERNIPVSLVRGTGPGQGSDGNGTSEGEEIATRKHEFQIIICNTRTRMLIRMSKKNGEHNIWHLGTTHNACHQYMYFIKEQ